MKRLPGNILPLALIMTLTILLAGLGIGAVVIEGSMNARKTDDSVAAYYMADSGVERELFEVRKNNQPLSYVNTLGGTYFNGGKWVSTGGYEQATNKKISSIATSSFAVIDLFDPDNLTSPPGISQMAITWSSACAPSQSRLEVSYANWKITGGVPELPADDAFVVLPKDGSGSMNVTTLDPNTAYRVRIRAFDCDATDLTVSLADSGGTPKIFPGDITISAEGTYGAATQKIAVTLPKLDVLSNLFGFVIFSECSLVKGTGSPVCPP